MNMSAATVLQHDFGSTADRDLVATAITGVEGSFEELVRRYQRRSPPMYTEWWAITNRRWI